MKLEVQKYLDNNSIEDLKEEFKIKVVEHKNFSNLKLFKYSQIESPFKEKIVQECRGLILDENNNWSVVCMTYQKFFNYNEPLAPKLDYKNVSIYEKYDGTLIQLYYYNGQWNFSTSGSPDASCTINKKDDIVFDSLAKTIWSKLQYIWPKNENMCYAFELITEKNRIVSKYKNSFMVLHGARNRKTLKEFLPSQINTYNWLCAKLYGVDSFEDAVELSKNINPIEQEGFVIVDYNFNRVKIKSPKYVALHRLISGINDKRILELVLMNEGDEFLSYFPEYKKEIDRFKKLVQFLLSRILFSYSKIAHIENKKEFAIIAKDSIYSSILFALKNKKIQCATEGLNKMNINKLLEILYSIEKEEK